MMKKSGKMIVAMTMAFSLLFAANPAAALAAQNGSASHSETRGGVTVNMSCSVSEKSGYASTTARVGYAWTSVSAMYAAVSLENGETKAASYYDDYGSNSGYYGSSVSFSAPSGYKSYWIESSHDASVTSDFAPSATLEAYYE